MFTGLFVCLFGWMDGFLDKNTETEDTKRHAEAMFKDVGEAYSVLSDPNKRRRYDSGEDLQDMEGAGGMHSGNVPLFYTLYPPALLYLGYCFRYFMIMI